MSHKNDLLYYGGSKKYATKAAIEESLRTGNKLLAIQNNIEFLYNDDNSIYEIRDALLPNSRFEKVEDEFENMKYSTKNDVNGIFSRLRKDSIARKMSHDNKNSESIQKIASSEGAVDKKNIKIDQPNNLMTGLPVTSTTDIASNRPLPQPVTQVVNTPSLKLSLPLQHQNSVLDEKTLTMPSLQVTVKPLESAAQNFRPLMQSYNPYHAMTSHSGLANMAAYGFENDDSSSSSSSESSSEEEVWVVNW